MSWDDHAEGWDDDPAVQAFASAAYEAVSQRVKKSGFALESSRVLDFGCGTGLLTRALATVCKEVVALDPSPKMIAVLRKHIATGGWEHVHAIEGTLDDALCDSARPLEAAFDLVVCSSVCAFLDDFPGTVQALSQLLRPGGMFIQFDWERDDTSAEPFGLTKPEITTALAGAGFADIVVGTGFERAIGDYVMKPLMGSGRRPDEP